MPINPNTNAALHKKLPIDPDENVLAVYKHHWYAYASSWIITAMLIVFVVVSAVLLVTTFNVPDQYHQAIEVGALLLSAMLFLGGMVPVYLRSQEQLVLTDESLLRVLQPTLFATKIDQLGLQHVADVSFSQDFMGSMMGYGKLTVETPGEQQTNYEFYMLPNPRDAAQQINEQHENYDAALQGGKLDTTMGQPAAPAIDPQEFQEFLEFQQMKQQQAQRAAAGQPAQGQAPNPAAPQDTPAQPAGGMPEQTQAAPEEGSEPR